MAAIDTAVWEVVGLSVSGDGFSDWLTNITWSCAVFARVVQRGSDSSMICVEYSMGQGMGFKENVVYIVLGSRESRS